MKAMNSFMNIPKMNASSDAEVIKQSASAMISVMLGMVIGAILIGFIFVGLAINIPLEHMMIIEAALLIITTIILWNILKTYGTKKYRQIEI